MRSHASFSDPSQPPSRTPLWLGALLLLGAGLLVFAHLTDKGAGGSARALGGPSRSTYTNRSVIRRAPSGPWEAPPEKPVVKGVVYDAEGHTLRDVEVIAMTFEIAGNIPEAISRARSDELGRFELRLQEGTYQLSAGLEGYGHASATAHTGDTLSLVLPQSGAILGHVVDERGNPVSHFVIDVIIAAPTDVPAPPPVFSRQFDSLDGSFRVDQLPSWDVIVRAAADGLAPTYSSDINVAPGKTEKVELKLSPGCVLTGKVVDQSGAPVPSVLVDAEASLGVGALSSVSAQITDQAESEKDGAFRLRNVPKGTVIVHAYSGESAVTTQQIEVSDCQQLEPVNLVMGAGGFITGVARHTDGTPVAGARVTLMHRSIGFVNAKSGADGSFRFDRLPPGVARLELREDERSVQQLVTVEDGKETQADLSLAPGGTGQLQGRVTAGGKPLSGIELTVIANLGRGNGLGFYRAVTGEDGGYRVDDLPPGKYVVNASSTPVTSGTRVQADQTATLNLDVSAQLKSRSTPATAADRPARLRDDER